MAPRLTFAPMNGLVRPGASRPSPRLLHRLLVRFGGQRPELPGVTANLSESGLFIITDQPRPIGAGVEIDLRFAEIPIFLGGEVVWISPERREGRSVGFGVRLVRKRASIWISCARWACRYPRLPDGAVIGSRCLSPMRKYPCGTRVGAFLHLPTACDPLSAANKEKYGRHWTRPVWIGYSSRLLTSFVSYTTIGPAVELTEG
jgi:hypothetical protein